METHKVQGSVGSNLGTPPELMASGAMERNAGRQGARESRMHLNRRVDSTDPLVLILIEIARLIEREERDEAHEVA
jgi:hypothetical protein